MSQVRWGFVSTATIGHRNWQAVKLSGNGVVAGVASRTSESAESFIEDCQNWCGFSEKPVAFGSYQALIESDQIDAVYIPLPTGLRKEWVIAAAQAGKHVICEKPCSASLEDLTEMVNACKENNVQFMDGVMFMHTDRMNHIRAALQDASNVGDVRRIHCQFSFCADEEWMASDIRLDQSLEPQGCLGDLGWYCIRYILWTLNYQMPERVEAKILTERHRAGSPGPVPVEFSAELFFEQGVTASFYCSFITHHQQWANISGTKGYLHLNDFVLPYKGDQMTFEISNADFVMTGCDFEMLNHRRVETVNESGNSTENSEETKLFRNFNELVLSGNPNYEWAEIALKTQQVMDRCLEVARQNRETASV